MCVLTEIPLNGIVFLPFLADGLWVQSKFPHLLLTHTHTHTHAWRLRLEIRLATGEFATLSFNCAHIMSKLSMSVKEIWRFAPQMFKIICNKIIVLACVTNDYDNVSDLS